MLTQTHDLIIGILFFSLLILLAILVAKLLQIVNKSRHTRAIAALAPLIQGTIDGDEHSAWITGNFRGRLVRATMTPNRNIRRSSEYSIKINSFKVAMLQLKGTHSWEIAYTGILWKKWKISTLDGAFKERLIRSGMIAELERIGNRPNIGYNPREAMLWYHENTGSRLVPTPQRFQAQLRLLAYIADFNSELNTRFVNHTLTPAVLRPARRGSSRR